MARSLRFTFPAILIFVVVGIREVASGLYFGLGREEPALCPLLLSVTLFWAIGWWLSDDLRGRSEGFFYCRGLVLWIAWPVLLPYYLLKTRGRKALITMAIFVGLSLAATVLGDILGTLLA